MKITVPKNIEKAFISFLDIAQASFTEDDIFRFTREEKETLRFVEKLIGESRSKRYATKAEQDKAAADLRKGISGGQ